MSHITITRGLNIPIEGAPLGAIQPQERSSRVAYTFNAFDETKFRVFVQPGDDVVPGKPLAEDKDVPGRYFVSYWHGKVQEVRRGEKRRLQAIVIQRTGQDSVKVSEPKNPDTLSKEELIKELLEKGLFAFIRRRPFNRLARPNQTPRSIFVKAIESAPFVPPQELHVQGYEEEFRVGLRVLKKLTQGPVHLIYAQGSTQKAFLDAQGVEKHTVSGPHPASNPSVHIHYIDPIKKVDDVVWTVTALDVVAIGLLFTQGKLLTERVVALAGDGILPQKRGFVKALFGHSIGELVTGKQQNTPQRLISGDPLTGESVTYDDFLGACHTTVTAIPEPTKRPFLHFLRLGKNRYTASGAYLSGHGKSPAKKYFFTTSQHGEERAFIDGTVYQKVMPMNVLVMQLVKALISDDLDTAASFGLLEVVPEDFALPEFVCPSKIEMMDIVKEGLHTYAAEHLGPHG